MGLEGRDEKGDTDIGINKEESGLGLFAKMGAATKSLKQSVEGSNIISEFNREQEKFIKEKSEYIICMYRMIGGKNIKYIVS